MRTPHSGAAAPRRLTACAVALLLAAACGGATERDKVIILVVDGLRPDYVTPEIMPTLNALAEGGVRGVAHHAVFPTVTRVNGPSIFTGRNPGGHGLLGNSVFLPAIDSTRVLDMSDAADLRLIDEATDGRLLTTPSLGEVLAEQGLTYFAASSGSTGSATLMNHRGVGGGLVHHELTIPDTLGPLAAELLGPVPVVSLGSSSVPLVGRAIDALLSIGLDRADADVAAAWLTEPDGTAHLRGIGAPGTIAVLGAVDAEIARLLEGLEARGLSDRANILITSDHGFTTYTGTRSLTDLLVDAGLKESARSTDVVVAGYAIHVRVGGERRIQAIVRLLQQTDWIGPVFTRGGTSDAAEGRLPGTISFGAIGWDHGRSADILTSPGWSDAENEHGYRGEVFTTGIAGHGSASPWDIRATFIAAGPAIKSGVVSDIPSGNVDLTPTALHLVGAEIPRGLDGRVLEEVLVGGPQPDSLTGEGRVVQTAVELDDVRYELTVYRSGVGTSTYFDGADVVRTRTQGQATARTFAPQAPPVVITENDIGDGFYGPSTPFAETSRWLGLYRGADAAEVRRAVVDWTVTPDDDDPGRSYYGMTVDPPTPTLLFGDVPGLEPRSAAFVTRYSVSLGTREPELHLTLEGVSYRVRLDGSDPMGCDARITLDDGSRTQVLYEGDPAACDEPHFEVVWSGDVDGDRRLDLVSTFSPEYSAHPRTLWLSTAGGSGQLVGEAASYDRTAM